MCALVYPADFYVGKSLAIFNEFCLKNQAIRNIVVEIQIVTFGKSTLHKAKVYKWVKGFEKKNTKTLKLTIDFTPRQGQTYPSSSTFVRLEDCGLILIDCAILFDHSPDLDGVERLVNHHLAY